MAKQLFTPAVISRSIHQGDGYRIAVSFFTMPCYYDSCWTPSVSVMKQKATITRAFSLADNPQPTPLVSYVTNVHRLEALSPSVFLDNTTPPPAQYRKQCIGPCRLAVLETANKVP